MAAAESGPASDPEVIGNAFVEQFYTVLHEHPAHAFKFYLDSSVLSRPGPDDTMKSVTSLNDINELILSLDFKSYKTEISFADAQVSYANGVIVLVTGYLIGKNNVKRKFTQSFFLAPQERGHYYVSNDVFRYVDDKESAAVANNDVHDSTQAALPPEPELTHAPKNAVGKHTPTPSANGDASAKEVGHSLDHSSKVSVSEDGVEVVLSSRKFENDSLPVSQTSSSDIPEDAPKKSYLSVVHALTKNSAPFITRAQVSKPKPLEQSRRAVASPEASPPKSNKALERNNSFSGGNNTFIFVANLPLDATEEMLGEMFLKFGPIKPNGIQVRSFKEQKNCYGFVEFESVTSAQSAITASRITIGNRQANIEEKRGGGNRDGRQSRSGYRDENGYRNNDNLKGRGNFNSGHNFGRNERRNEDNNKKIYQNGRQRVAREDQSQI